MRARRHRGSIVARAHDSRLASLASAGVREELIVTAGGPRFADRLARLVAVRESQIVLGLDPDPARLWPEAAERPPGRPGRRRERAAAAVTAHCRAVDRRGRAGLRRGQAAARLLRAPRRAGLGRARRDCRARARRRPARARRRQARRHRRQRRRLRPGARRARRRRPSGRSPGLGADAFTANPYMGRDTLEVLAAARARRRRRRLRARPHLEPRRRRRRGPRARRRRHGLGARGRARRGARRRRGPAGSATSAPSSAPPRPEHIAGCAS